MASKMDAATTGVPGAADAIIAEVTSWPGMSAGPGRRGELSLRYGGKKEIGHLHSNRVAHFGFPRGVWRELKEAGRIDFHPVFPGKEGWASRAIETTTDVEDVIAMLRLNYDRASGDRP